MLEEIQDCYSKGISELKKCIDLNINHRKINILRCFYVYFTS